MWIYVGSCCFFSTSYFFSQNKERNWWWQQLKSSLRSVLLLPNWPIMTVSESSRCGRSSASDMYSTGSWLGCKRGRVLFGKLWIFHCERKKKRFVYSERKHGETESSSQNFTQYRKLLAMRKKCFFSFSWVLISLCESSVWMNVFSTSVYAKGCPFHGFFIYFLSWGNSWECTPGPSVSSAVCLSEGHRGLCVSSWCPKLKRQRQYPHLVEVGLVSSTLPCFLFFFALLKGSFPTQFV